MLLMRERDVFVVGVDATWNLCWGSFKSDNVGSTCDHIVGSGHADGKALISS